MKTVKGKLIIVSLLGLLIVLAFLLMSSPIKKKVVLEAGHEIHKELFKTKEEQEIEWVSDISAIDTNIVGEYEIQINYKNKTYQSLLTIQDTTAPIASSKTYTTAINQLPEAIDLLDEVKDASSVSAAYKEEIDVSKEQDIQVVVVLTDAYNNISEIESTIRVIEDKQAPVISGTKNIFVAKGDTVSYRDGISISDNCDQNIDLVIDNTQVNLDKLGVYKVTYSATDLSGNKSEKVIKVYVEEKSVTKDKVYEKCDEILAKITNEDMSQLEVAFEIYKWTKTHIGYANSTEKSSWVKGAYQGLFKHQGDCYTYFATCKALLTRAGIDNIDIQRNKIKVQHHYWSLINIGDGWYHIDTTPRKDDGDNFFMCTTEDLRKFKKSTHRFDESLYPKIATKSIQHLIDYERGKILK